MKTRLQILLLSGFMILIGFMLANLIYESVDNVHETVNAVRPLFYVEGSEEKWLMMSNSEGIYPTRFVKVTGSMDWSPNGELIATGCEEPFFICIYDAGVFLQHKNRYPLPVLRFENTIKPIQQIELPDECRTYIAEEVDWTRDNQVVSSISWANDNRRMAIVCGNRAMSRVCILSRYKNSFCWPEEASYNLNRVNWSPVSDNLLVSGRDEKDTLIYQSNVAGDQRQPLTVGWRADWSSNGKEIIFLCDIDTYSDPMKFADLCIINQDGSNRRVVFHNPVPLETDDLYYYTTFHCADQDTCRLSWSPDEKYVIFNGNIHEGFASFLMRYDLATGEIKNFGTLGITVDPVLEP